MAFLAADDHWKDRGVKKKLEVKTLNTQGMISNHRQKPGAGNKITAPMGDSPMSGLSQSRTVEEDMNQITIIYTLTSWKSAVSTGILADHLLMSLSVLYLPDSILAMMTAFDTSKGLPAVSQRG